MQATLCVIFGCTIALAQWVVHERYAGGSLALDSTPFKVGPLRVYCPRGWHVRTHNRDELELFDDSGEAEGLTRVLTIDRYTPKSPAPVFLEQHGFGNGVEDIPITIAGFPGVLTYYRGPDQETGLSDAQYLAGGISSSGIGVVVGLACQNEPESEATADRALITQIARRMTISGDSGQ